MLVDARLWRLNHYDIHVGSPGGLTNVPDSFIVNLNSLFLHTINYPEKERRILPCYSKNYKIKVLRVAPNYVSISESEASATFT